ncbi:MAG TPA: type II secretion system F family protein, partial [Candidatus Nanoarchaeia archaeon]|nr:type II secretion system F family protein [Candidatus Nanoarchaeia archaeon]
MKTRIPLMLISMDRSIKIGKRMQKLVSPLENKRLASNLKQARINVKPIEFLSAVAVNTIVYFLLFTLLFTTLFISQEGPEITVITRGLSTGLLMGLIFFLVLYTYPGVLAGKIGNIIDSELFYALNDMLIQLKSKVELYQALVNVVEGDYGYVSDELLDVINDVESGKSMVEALKKLALRTKSDFMKRMAWQLMNSIKSGSDAIRVIDSLIKEIEVYYHSVINKYTKELNVLSLIYLT